MKNLLFITLAALLTFGCINRNKTNDTAQASENGTPVEQLVAEDEHGAKNSLDYEGTYSGKIESAEHKGLMELSLTITYDGTFKRSVKLLEDASAQQAEGKFVWETGSIIKLDAVTPNRFFVGENLIYVLEGSEVAIPADLHKRLMVKE